MWNFYPDPDANNIDEAQYVIERHKISRSQMRNLKNVLTFDQQLLKRLLHLEKTMIKNIGKNDLADYAPEHGVDRFEVFEYWGMCDVEMLQDQGVDIPKELTEMDELQANVWICNGKLIRMVLNPFKPAKIPYMAAPYELNPYSFFGVGIAENMDDTQTLDEWFYENGSR